MAMDLQYRELRIGPPKTADDDSRTVNIVAATESPCPMPDWERMAMVDEVLLMSGVRVANQVPLLNSHSRFSTGDVLGSARDVSVDGDKLVAKAVFASTQAASDAWSLVRDGHLTDLSVGYTIEKKRHVPDGETQVVGGRSFTGPVNVVTKWKVREISVTPIGADENAKVREYVEKVRALKDAPAFDGDGKAGDQEASGDPTDGRRQDNKEGAKVNEKIRALCVSRGMPAELDDAAAMEWLAANTDKLVEKSEVVVEKIVEKPAAVDVRSIESVLRKIEAEKAEKRKALKSHVDERCKKYSLGDAAKRELESCESIEEANEKLVDLVAARQSANRIDTVFTGSTIEFGADQTDKVRGAIKTSLVDRFLVNVNENVRDKVFPKASRSQYASDFNGASLFEMARQYVQYVNGIDTRNMNRVEIAKLAWGFDVMRSDAPFHVTSSFGDLTLDAQNKTLLASYEEYPMTWRVCFAQAPSVSDFKNIHRVRLSESPNLDVWLEGKKPNEIGMSDEKETYAVQAYSNTASFGYHLIVNDDLAGLVRIPQKMGAAAARTVNAAVWSVITSNPTMSDGQALFLSALAGNRLSGVNLLTTTGAPSVSTVQNLGKLLRLQKGVNKPDGTASDAILGLIPKFIIGPAALETTILQLVNSTADPAASGNAGIYNPARSLTPVIEPLLDSSSATAWYLAAAPSQVDTVEVSFLQGQESPMMDSWRDPEDKSLKFNITQSFGAKAIDHRGLAKHNNA